jgi:hypothetical protein
LGENFNKFCFIFFYLTVKLLKEINWCTKI